MNRNYKKKRTNNNMKNLPLFKSDFLTSNLCNVWSIHFTVFEFENFM